MAVRIVRFANLVGRENVQAGTDCGFGNPVRPDIGVAKMRSTAAGSKMASDVLWG